MQFDWPDEADFPQQQAHASSADENDRPLIPDGTHLATIRWAGEQQREWAKHEDNQTGKVLSLKLDFGPEYRPVWESVRAHWRGLVGEVCRAARIEPPAPRTPWSESQLVGQVVSVETVLAVSKAGKEYVRIDKWREGPPVVEAPKVERRTLAQKATAEFRANGGGSDDIPF